MNLLFRYLTKNNALILLPTLGVGVGIYVLTDLFERLDNFLEAQVSFGMVALYFVVKMPLVISQLLPVIFLLATVIQLCLMARNRELIALQTGGISLAVVARSMIICGVFWSIAQLGFSEFLGVSGERESVRIWQEEVRKRNLAATVLKDIWFSEGDWIVSVATLNPDSTGTGLTAYKIASNGKELEQIVTSPEYSAQDNHWIALNAKIYSPSRYLQESQERLELPLTQDVATFRLINTGNKKPQQLPIWQLGTAIEQLKASGSNVEHLRTTWHSKLAYAASILILAFVATAIVSWKDNIYLAVILALVCTFLYYALYTLGTSLGQRGMVHPFLAAWGANFIALICALGRLVPVAISHK